MTIENKDKQEPSPGNKSSLPLQAVKKIPIHLYGVVVIFLFIVLANFLFGGGNNISQKPDEAIENYTLKPINPNANQDDGSNHELTNQDKLRKEVEVAKAKDFIERLQAGQTVEGGSFQSAASASSQPTSAARADGGVGHAAGYPQDANTAYLASVTQTSAERAFAQRFSPQPYLIGQGKFIFATLSVAINSDLPGQVSAIVNQDIYGEQGRNVLIPRGSRLVGEYRSMLGNNQSRIFVVWTRVIQPDGISVMIGSEGTDALGQAGMTGDVNYHFLARFGTASLISLIGAGASTIGVNPDDQYNSMSAYRQAVAQAMSEQASSLLSNSANIPPTVHVTQGERVVVFVNKDLDFSRVYR